MLLSPSVDVGCWPAMLLKAALVLAVLGDFRWCAWLL